MTTMGQRGILAFRGLQKFKPVHAGKFKVSENEVDWLGSEQLQSSFGVAGRERLEPIVARFSSSRRRILASSSMMRMVGIGR